MLESRANAFQYYQIFSHTHTHTHTHIILSSSWHQCSTLQAGQVRTHMFHLITFFRPFFFLECHTIVITIESFRSKDFRFERTSQFAFRSNVSFPSATSDSIETQNAKSVRIESLLIEKIRTKVKIDPIVNFIEMIVWISLINLLSNKLDRS